MGFRTRHFEFEALSPGLGFYHFEEGYSLHLFGLWWKLRFLGRPKREPSEVLDSWSFKLMPSERCFHLSWGRDEEKGQSRYKIVHFPWAWEHVRHEVLNEEGKLVPYVASYERDKEPDGRKIEVHPYLYKLRCGEIQERTATIYVEEREWRWRWLTWLPFPRLIRRSIDVRFNDEVGERTGSWKGGTLGCGYEMKPGETPLETLRRMEAEREFN